MLNDCIVELLYSRIKGNWHGKVMWALAESGILGKKLKKKKKGTPEMFPLLRDSDGGGRGAIQGFERCEAFDHFVLS